MNYEGEKFLLKLYRELYNKDSVKHSGTVSDNKYELLNKYLNRLERTEELYNSERKELIKYIKNRYYDKYVIKKENMSDKTNKKLVIDTQRQSLDKWLDYLFQTKEEYPMWAKYWAFQGMLQLGQYDKDNKSFTKRSKRTLSPFTELNETALNQTIQSVIEYQKGIIPEDKTLENLILNGNFGNLYAYNIEKQINKQKDNNSTKGIWKEYRYEDSKKLAKSLENKNTFWCLINPAMAANYLEYGTIYIYYTKDKQGTYTIPRICIRTENTDVREVKGVLDKNDNLEYEMIEIVKEKLNEFYGGNKFKQIADDTKLLTDIYEKYQNNIELNKQELRFLYEIDREIGSFTWVKDSRIRQIINTRDKKQDLSTIFNCSKDKIGITNQELTKDDLYIYYGSIDYEGTNNYIIPPIVIGNINITNTKEVQGFDNLYLVSGSINGDSLHNVENFKNLEIVIKDLSLKNVKTAKGLEKLTIVGGALNLDSIVDLKGLDRLKEVKNLSLKSAKYAEGAPNLKYIKGNLIIPKMIDLRGFKSLETIDNSISCYASSSTNCLPNLEIKGNNYFYHIINIHDIKRKILSR